MLGLSGGEWFLLCFIAGAVISWPWWPRLGAAIAGLLAGADQETAAARDDDASQDD